MDSLKDPNEFLNFLKIHNILSKINISIPKIYEIDSKRKIILLEDFGDLRFDRILKDYDLKSLLFDAVNSLIIIKKEINFDPNYNLPIYNYKIFTREICEFVDYFYPYYQNKIMPLDLKKEFIENWKSLYDSLDLNFTSFVHKDYNFNNLFYLPSKKKHYKCGIIDFQNSFWGEDCWDLFSLLEDSRVNFDDQYSEFFINYFCLNTNKKKYFKLFIDKYYIFNCSRQTRLLGRWIKLSNNFKQKWYLDFIKVTKKRLIKSLQKPCMKKINVFYKKLIPSFYDI